MGKRDSAPTYGWVFTSWINKWIVRICLFVTAITLVAGATVIARLDDDCTDKPEWTMDAFGYSAKVAFEKPCR